MALQVSLELVVLSFIDSCLCIVSNWLIILIRVLSHAIELEFVRSLSDFDA